MISTIITNLTGVAVPTYVGAMLIIISIQVIVLIIYAVFVVFRLMGKDYDVAVIVEGLLGHGLGATPNALANMNSNIGLIKMKFIYKTSYCIYA